MAAVTYTGLQLIRSAMRKGNLIPSGEPLDPAEAADALDTLNQMLESWSAERLLVFFVPRLVFNLVSGKQTYTMGTDGTTDFNSARPPRINKVSVVSLANAAQPLELPLIYTTDELVWQDVRVKNIQSSLPRLCYDDMAMPNRNLNFYPIPNIANQVAVYPWTALTAFPDLTTALNFPPGYARAIVYSLAEELAPEYDKQLHPNVSMVAAKAREVLRSMNAPPMHREVDPVLLESKSGTYNWLTDDAELD